MSNAMSDRLAAARREWEDVKTPPPGSGGGDLPDGRYQVEIDAGTCIKEDKNGGTGILWKLVVADGDEKGHTQTKWGGLLDRRGRLLEEDRIKWVKRDFATLLGEPLEDIEKLEETIEDLIGKETEIEVKTKGNFTNVYFTDEATGGGKRKDRDEDEDEDPPRKKRREEPEEEEEERPSKSRRRDEDEEEERPRAKSKREESEEDEDPPRKRKARDDADDDEKQVRDLLKKNRRK